MTEATPAGSPRQRFRSRLAARPLLVDGGLGTLLFSRGVPQRACLEELVATHPEMVGAAHREYLEAGAELIETLSFGANRQRLAAWGLEGQVGAFNRRAAQLAREAREVSGRDALVGWLGRATRVAERAAGRPSPRPRARAAFREQIEGLLEGGADLIVLETFSDLEQLLLAVDEARRASDVPVIASLTFGEELLLADGSSPGVAAAALARGRRGRGRRQLRGRAGGLSRCARGDGRARRMATPRGRSCPTPGSRSGSRAASSTPRAPSTSGP